MLIERNLEVSSISGENVINFLVKISASEISRNDVSYVFFLNNFGRYVADSFLFENEGKFFFVNDNFEKLKNYIEKYDIRKKYKIKKENLFVYWSFDYKSDFKDPRNLGYIFLKEKKEKALDEGVYEEFRIKNLFAEFRDFESEKSIVLEYGKIANFISIKKGCYPGQELMARTLNQGIIRKKLYIIVGNFKKGEIVKKEDFTGKVIAISHQTALILGKPIL